MSLTFKGESSIKSLPGGIVSLVSLSFVVYFIGAKFQELHRKKSFGEILTFQKDVILNPGLHVLDREKFEVAASLSGGDLQFDADYDKYLRIVFFQYYS